MKGGLHQIVSFAQTSSVYSPVSDATPPWQAQAVWSLCGCVLVQRCVKQPTTMQLTCMHPPHKGLNQHYVQSTTTTHRVLSARRSARTSHSTRNVRAAWANDRILWLPQQQRDVVTAPKDARPLVILPGFGNDTTDYTAPFGLEDRAIATHLRARGWHVEVVQLQRRDWFNVGRSVFTRGFYSSSLTTDPGYTWYLQRVAAAVQAAMAATGSAQVDLLGHSAGGWLARAFLSDPAYGAPADGSGPNPAVASIITLGSPHRPPPPSSGIRDMTGGALTWVNQRWPGACFADAGVRYICVAGRSVRGNALPAASTQQQQQQQQQPQLRWPWTKQQEQQPQQQRRPLARYAHDAYMQVVGEGQGVEGDCVVPLAAAQLVGATNIVLDGVMHSMSRIGTFSEVAPAECSWYGDATVLDHWLHAVADPSGATADTAAALAAAPAVAAVAAAADMTPMLETMLAQADGSDKR